MSDPNNPYAPPQTSDLGVASLPPSGMPVHSSIPKVFGVLSIVFAALVGLGGLMESCSFAAAGFAGSMSHVGGDAKLEEMRPMMDAMKSVYTGFGFHGLIFLAMSIWLLVLGIGQMRYRAWASKQSVTWGLVALVMLGVMVLISVMIIGPAYRNMFDAIAHAAPHGGEVPKMPAGIGAMMGGSLSVMLVLFNAPYPILMIAMFSRENVRASMTT